MQATVNALMNIGTPASTGNAGSAGASGQGDDTAPNNQFAQLLSDSGHQADEQGAQQFTRGQQLPQTNGATALVAQDIGTPTEEMLEEVLKAQTISVQDAADLSKKLDAMLAHTDDKAIIAALTQVKNQLKHIQTDNQPKSAADIIAAVPELKDAGIDLQAMAALLNTKKLTAAESEEASAQVAVAMQNLSALVFRADRRADQAASIAAGKKEKKSDAVIEDAAATAAAAAAATVTVVQPLSYVASVPVTAVTAQDISTPAIAANGMPQPRPDLDEAIPPLDLKPSDQELPEVNLPKAGPVVADAKADAKASFEQQLSALNSATPKDGKPTEIVGANDNKDIQTLTTLMNPSHTGGHSATQTANAVQPAHIVNTGNYINHAPVAEQVHVAINQAAKDGMDKITIQLDPVDLGRVEIHMQRSHDGQTQIAFTVDKPETFDSLSRDARFLERSLQEAGIKADTGSMQFNLRQQPTMQMQSNLHNQNGQPQNQADEAEDEKTSSATPIQSVASFTRNYIHNIRDGVDISA